MRDPLVLLVEDDPDTREMYATFLGSVGYRVLQAANGVAALDVAKRQCPDIVVTDLAMPVMDGFRLTRELRASSTTCSVPVIAVTGHGVPTTPRLAREAGCCCLFTKPFLPDSLLDAVRSMLDACPRSLPGRRLPARVPGAAFAGIVSAKEISPSTPATRLLRLRGIRFSEHHYRFEAHGGTRVAARALQVDEHAVVKTLVMDDEAGRPLIVLMHGDREVSTKRLARAIGAKAVAPCKPEVAARHSGYMVGGTSPFGTRKPMPLYMERTILDLGVIYINGGSRGFLLGIAPQDLVAVLEPALVDVAIQAP